MIGLLLRLPVVLVMVIPLVWAAVLLGSGQEGPVLEGSLRELQAAYPEEPRGEQLLAKAAAASSGLSLGVGAEARLLRAGLLASALHGLVILRLLPLTLFLGTSGIAAGLALRERLRHSGGYASPTGAGVGRSAVGGALFWLGLYALSPLPVAMAWAYLSLPALALGGMIYVANLPLKL